MEPILSRENMMAAYHRVVGNKGAPGIDAMTVEQLKPYLAAHWPRIREELLAGRYRPAPVRGVEIPKPGGKGMRQLGIPTVLDRLIQQAMHQVLMPIFDPDFSNSSFGFRPGRSAHEAVVTARSHVAGGRSFVVDLDLEKSAVDRPWKRVFLGRALVTVKDLAPILRGWMAYFRLTQGKGILEELDGWLRRRLRCILWRQWKRPATRATQLMQRGLTEQRARDAAGNGRGPWWNAGASHMNDAFRKICFDKLRLISLQQELRRLNHAA